MSVDDLKAAVRTSAKPQRKRAIEAAGDHGNQKFTANLISLASKIGVNEQSMIGGYWAMATELNVTPAMVQMMADFGAKCSLPVVIKNHAPLVFRAWQEGMILDSGGFGTHHPPESSPECQPNILLVPLLAFDAAGYRLGWGGGFYDRTLDKLRKAGVAVTAVGVAYAGQEVDEVVIGEYDEPLDWIVTENEARRIVSS